MTFSIRSTVVVALMLGLNGCSSTSGNSGASPAPTPHQLTTPFPFKALQDDQQMALKAYLKGERCPGGAKFGQIAKGLQFSVPTIDEVEESMKSHGCPKRVDVLRDLNNEPYKTRKGNTIPLWVWTCSEGTVVRIKPLGDPTSKFNTQAHGSVALRYPCDAPYNSFDDEMLKVDNNGNPIPKWARELDSQDPEMVEMWAHAAHFSVIVTDLNKR